MPIQLSIGQFMDRSSKIHNNKYDYSLVDYNNCMTKVKIICQIHGVFEQTPLNHLNGHICKKCSSYNVSVYQRKDKEFFEKVSIKFGNKYDYSLVRYKNRKSKVRIICPTHGEFLSTPVNHLKVGCVKCSKSERRRVNKNIFIDKSVDSHRNRYDYSDVEYISDKIKVRIICPTHGYFLQKPNDHILGVGCPSCSCSKGELKILNYLSDNSIEFEPQKKFDGCLFINNLVFDFYLPSHNICIEFDGKQHFKPIDFFGGIPVYNETKIRDGIKDQYCIDKSIKLIRMPYYDSDNVYKILDNNIWEH